jgi:septum formation protein
MLSAMGLNFEVYPSNLDESFVKKSVQKEGKKPAVAARLLAREKALLVSRHHPDAFVIGADQIMSCEGRWFDKAETLEEAQKQLEFLRGKTHFLETATCVALNSKIVWESFERPKLTMRSFSDDFLTYYLESVGSIILSAVGCYQVEREGIQLFEQIEGNIFSIMGLCVLPLLSFLRKEGILHE